VSTLPSIEPLLTTSGSRALAGGWRYRVGFSKLKEKSVETFRLASTKLFVETKDVTYDFTHFYLWQKDCLA